MEEKRKKRGENWSSEEKELLRQLIAESANILEDKSTRTNINILKKKTWKHVANVLNELMGRNRSEAEVKLSWKRMKMAAKANLSLHRSELQQTGGGQKPASPSQEDMEIMAIAPHDFVVEVNDYDSDAVPINQTAPVAGCSKMDTTSYFKSQENVEDNVMREQAQPLKQTAPLTDCGKTNKFQNTEDSIVREQVTSISKNKETVDVNDSPDPNGTKRKKTISKSRIDEGRQAIIDSNANFKKRHIEMLKEEHKYNIEIAKLKIKKLQLEIGEIERRSNTNT